MYIISVEAASQCTYSCTICVAGVIVCADSSDAYIGFSDPASEAVELVDVLLRVYRTGGRGDGISARKAV